MEQPYWYYRMESGFFQENEIKIMLNREDGLRRTIILLKLYCLGTPNRGSITMSGDVLGAEGLAELAILVNEDVLILKSALEYYFQRELIVVKAIGENKYELLLPYVIAKTGKSSRRADLKRERERLMKAGELEAPKANSVKTYGTFKKGIKVLQGFKTRLQGKIAD